MLRSYHLILNTQNIQPAQYTIYFPLTTYIFIFLKNTQTNLEGKKTLVKVKR